ncbi:hypothetical protein J437_LFUL000041 [Ladona fulva]|uniref:Peptidyl-prolyl cis-trans isomerase n=1 Tax=Ladona fulva TaxID=123851 RepID=A0A8K0JYN4_LADFU|nr:hypothetical protein J437_LFUL000041 [Ladona fulva]
MINGEEAKYYKAETRPKIKHARTGLISMVNCGNNMVGSQFFFTLGADLHSLDGEHCVFGEVTEGAEVLIQLNEVICDEKHHPFRDIRITHIVILEDPFDDPPNLVFPDFSPEPTKERLMNGRIAPDEEIDDTKGKTLEAIEEMVLKREAQTRATILEIVGDIPYAEIAPPENVLFVCKLNPVTTDEDLKVIFGRFGTIKSCELIRDKTTGDSRQYAFIEFEDKKACEDAYFKMDNTLIDDRRIHVDFSQSVAKIRWRGKGIGVDYFPDASQKGSQSRVYKDSDFFRKELKKTKQKRSRSRSPHSRKNHDDRHSEKWEKYNHKDKHRESSSRLYKKSKDSSNGKIKNYDDRSKGVESLVQLNSEHSQDLINDNNNKWDGRRRLDGKDYNHHGRSYVLDNLEVETSRSREKRHCDFERSEKQDGDADEKYRTSKVDKHSKNSKPLHFKSEWDNKGGSKSKKIHGKSFRYDKRKDGKNDTSRYRNPDKSQRESRKLQRGLISFQQK